jgi:outer membrane lipoprotein-sorting protein
MSAVTFLSAQTPEVAKAKQILDKVALKTKGYQTIKADFSFTLENVQEKLNDTHTGKILIKGDKYKIDLMGVDTYFNGKTIWMYLKDVAEVNISEPDATDEETLNPATIFSIYEKGYKYLHVGEATLNGKKVDIIDLFPEKRDKSFSRVKLYIYQDNSQIGKITQIGKDGNNYIIDIKKMEVNVPAEDSVFTFDAAKHPKVEVIDMR